MKIPSIITKPASMVGSGTKKFFNGVANTKFIKDQLDVAVSEPMRFAARMLIYSIVTKDVINCIFYTTQSWNNKSIEEDKRKFIAAQDAMNGLIMVGGQMFVGKVIDNKFAPWIKSKFTGTAKNADGVEQNVGKNASKRIFHSDNTRDLIYNTIRDNAKELKNKFGVSVDDIKPANIESMVKSVNKKCKEPFIAGLGILVTAIATTGLMKRGVTYLVSTPLAGMITDYMDKKDAAKKKNMEAEMTPAMIDMTMPKIAEERNAFSKVVSK